MYISKKIIYNLTFMILVKSLHSNYSKQYELLVYKSHLILYITIQFFHARWSIS